MGGEGVFLAAILGDGLGEEVAGHRLGAAEHHMLEEMRQAGNAGRIVHRADLEPQHLGDHGGAMIGDHHHLHAVGQGELEDAAARAVILSASRGFGGGLLRAVAARSGAAAAAQPGR